MYQQGGMVDVMNEIIGRRKADAKRTTGSSRTCKMATNFHCDLDEMKQIGRNRDILHRVSGKQKVTDRRTCVTYPTQDHEGQNTGVFNENTATRRALLLGLNFGDSFSVPSWNSDDDKKDDDVMDQDEEEEGNDGDDDDCEEGTEDSDGGSEEGEYTPLCNYRGAKRRTSNRDSRERTVTKSKSTEGKTERNGTQQEKCKSLCLREQQMYGK